MCNVYSFSGFAKVLIKNGITFSIRDFLDDKKVDMLIQKLVNKTCGDGSWVGSGIARSCFVDPWRLAAIKVDKGFFVHIDDECAAEEWEDHHWRYNIDDYDSYGYITNKLNVITKSFSLCTQNQREISSYKSLFATKSNLLEYLPTMYAVSSNGAVEIMEFCQEPDLSDFSYQSDRKRFISKRFSDTHDGNYGVNKLGLLVLLDYGFENY